MEFQCEKRLSEVNPFLHGCYRQSIFALQRLLESYRKHFKEYTDHTIFHALDVIELCNELVGETVRMMCGEELYVLLMGALLHDVGMGIREKDFAQLAGTVTGQEYDGGWTEAEKKDLIRRYHQEFGACFVHRYWRLLEIPDDRFAFAIAQVVRGHRKTDLMDEFWYPSHLRTGNGEVCLPYLAAVVKLADELDISDSRISQAFDSVGTPDNPVSEMEFAKHRAVKRLEMQGDRLMAVAEASDEVWLKLLQMQDKIRGVLEECRTVAEKRSPYVLELKDIIFIRNETES